MTLVSAVSYLSLADLGIGSSVGRFVGQHRAVGAGNQVPAFFGTVIAMYAAILVVVLGCAIAITQLLPLVVKIPADAAPYLTPTVIGIALSVAISIWANGLLSALHASQELPVANAIRIAAIVSTGALLVLAAATGTGIVGLAAATAVGALLTLGVAVWTLHRRLPWVSVGRPSKTQARRLGSYGSYMSIIFLASVVNFQTDNLVIASTIGVAAVAAYSIALRVTRSLVLLIHKIPDVLFPFYVGMVARNDYARLKGSFIVTARLELAGATCFCLLLLFSGPTLLSWWVGRDNVVAISAFWLALVMMLIEAIVHPAAIVAIAAGGERKLAIVSIVEALANLAISILLARKLGIAGVILGTVIAHCLFTGWWLPRWAMRRADLRATDYARQVLLPCLVPGILSVLIGGISLIALSDWNHHVSLAGSVASAFLAFVISYAILRRRDDLPAAIEFVGSIFDRRLLGRQGSQS
jgi:O-antigen/teichoic acid export membrane protein